MSLKIAMIRNVGASGISKLLSVLYSLVSVTILISNFGIEKYGIWLVISAIPAWLSMSDLGFGSVAANEMSIRVAKNDWKGANAVFQSAMAAILSLSLITSFIIFFSIISGNWNNWLGITSISKHDLSIALIFLGFTSVLALQGSLASGLFRAGGRADLAIMFGAISPIMDLIGLIITSYFFKSISALSISLFISKFLFIIGSLLTGFVFCPKIKFDFNLFNWADFIFCLKKGLAFCIFPLGNAVMLQGSTLIVNHLLGAAAVVIFNTCRQLTRSSQQIMNLIGQSAAPEFSHLVGKGDFARARKLHYLTLVTNLTLALFMISILLFFGPAIYSFWIKGRAAIDRFLILGFSLGVLGNAFWFAGSTLIGASNRHERLAIIYLIGSLVSIPICYIGVKYFGIIGGAFASVSPDIFFVPIVFFEATKITKETTSEFLNGVVNCISGSYQTVYNYFIRNKSM